MQHCGADGLKEGLAPGRPGTEKAASFFETARCCGLFLVHSILYFGSYNDIIRSKMKGDRDDG